MARCHQDTRKDVIDKIVQWVKHSNSQICWLKGSAGSGKSAISQTIAERYAKKKRLAASFFFLRGAGNRSTITRFIFTLAYQLSISVPATKPLIEHILRNQSSQAILAQSITIQFDTLVIQPLLSIKKPFLPQKKPMVIVIDALDECDDKELMVEFISALISASQGSRRHLRFFVTSRLEEHIRKPLETPAARSAIQHLALDTFDARRDIRTYLRSQFSIIYEENRRYMEFANVSLPWPPASDLEALVEKCGVSFILATTIIKFINDGNGGLPHEKIQSALTLERGLDPLYTQVLSAAPRDRHFGSVVGTIMLLITPLSIPSLACLLQLSTADIIHALMGIQSILKIPGDDAEPIQVFHTSLRDFLTLRPSEFFVNPPIRHLYITISCLTAIESLPEDGLFYCKNGQDYACFYWCHHLHQALVERGLEDFELSTHLMSCIQKFASQLMDAWINTVIWKGEMPGLLTILSDLQVSSIICIF